MSFEKWKARLAICQGHNTVSARRAAIAASGIKTFMEPDAEDEGYYRKPLVEPALGPGGKTNGQKRLVGWVPCAYFLADGKLCGIVGAGDDMRDMTDKQLKDGEFWSWVVANPISYETYVAVAEDGLPWPDMPAPTPQAKHPMDEGMRRTQAIMEGKAVATDNQPTEPEAPKVKTADDYRKEIETLVANTPVKVLASDAEAAVVLGSKNTLAAVRLEADKAGRAIYEPMYREYQKVQKAWAPMVNTADDHEKRLNNSILVWREKERQRLAREQADAARAIQEEEERNQRAADRAIAAGEPEPEPEVTEIVVPTAQLAPLRPTAGTRGVREEIKTFVTITDSLAVATYFIANEKLQAVLQELATNAVRAGVENVPGITTRKGLV